MKHLQPLASLLVALLALPAAAQITVEASLIDNVRGPRMQTLYQMNAQSYPALTPLLQATGPARSYDFGPFSYSPPATVSFEVLPSAAGTPGAADPDFGGANWVQHLEAGGSFYAYYDLRDEGFFLMGSIFVQATDTDGNGVLDQSVHKNVPPDPTYRFPLTDGSTWNQQITGTTTGFGSTATVATVVDFAVEGWGTLITPAGSAPALRLRKTLTNITQNYTTRSYLFITNGTLGASIILDGQSGAVLSAAYSVDGGRATGTDEVPVHAFRLGPNYPNPFSSVTHLPFELDRPGHVSLRVFDLLGRQVGHPVEAFLPAGGHHAPFEAAGLPAGIYVYRLQVEGTTFTRHLVVRR